MTVNSTGSIEISNPAVLPEQPLVSIYMLTYNHENYISEAIDSVVAQKCSFPIELVIGEDCSTDRTRAIVEDYQKRFPQLIRIITGRENIGMRANGIRCRAACRGSYIAYCEGDDRWEDPEKLSLQVELLNSAPEVILACHAVNRLDAVTGRIKGIQHVVAKSRLLSTKEIILGDGDFIPTCSILVRRSIFDQRPAWWQQASFGDYPLVLRASYLGRVAYHDRVMGSYRVNVPGSWTMNNKTRSNIRDAYAHALEIKAIMLGFNADSQARYQRAVNFIIRRYIFNAIVKSSGDSRERLRILMKEASTLNILDYLLARVALMTGRKLARIREYPHRLYARFAHLINDWVEPEL